MKLPAIVEATMPFTGPCGFCGGPDSRHRILDAILDRVAAGDDEQDVADDYGVSRAVVEQIACHYTIESIPLFGGD